MILIIIYNSEVSKSSHPLILCFTNYKKAFDSADIKALVKLWSIVKKRNKN